MLNKYKNIFLNITALILVLGGVVLAGNIEPDTGAPAFTGYTLEDVYQKVSSSTYEYSAHTLAPTLSVSENSMHSLGDIYNVIPAYQTIDGSTTTLPAGIYATTTLTDITEAGLAPENIALGTTIFGVIGAFECTAP